MRLQSTIVAKKRKDRPSLRDHCQEHHQQDLDPSRRPNPAKEIPNQNFEECSWTNWKGPPGFESSCHGRRLQPASSVEPQATDVSIIMPNGLPLRQLAILAEGAGFHAPGADHQQVTKDHS